MEEIIMLVLGVESYCLRICGVKYRGRGRLFSCLGSFWHPAVADLSKGHGASLQLIRTREPVQVSSMAGYNTDKLPLWPELD